MKKLLIFFASLSLAACIQAPQGLERTENMLTRLTDVSQLSADCQCQRIRLGGKVLNATALKDKVQLEILSFPIGRFSGKPVLESQSDGRFIAYMDGFVDPENLKERYITLMGVFTAKEKGKIDQADYLYPIINVQHYRIWQYKQEYYYDPMEMADWREDRRRGFGYFWRPEPKLRAVLY